MGMFIGVFAFMLLPVWIPAITAIVDAVYDVVVGARKGGSNTETYRKARAHGVLADEQLLGC